MFVKALSLHSFRNYNDLVYTPDKGLNLICGDNAQGKTNLLEAVFLCAFGRSQRTVHDDELIMQGAESANVKLKAQSEDGAEHLISITLAGGAKSISLDGEKIKKLGDLMGVLKAVMFSPESLSLVKGAPAERRRFLDMSISQLSRSYFFKLQQYNTALKQRNALLKSPDALKCRDYIRMWDEQLAVSGAYIMNARAHFIDKIKPIVLRVHDKLSLRRDTFDIEFLPSVRSDGGEPLQEVIMQKLAASFDDDVRRGTTYLGAHKDDIAMRTNELDSRVYASQGQQRTAALALRLSEIELIHEVSGEYPVVLLDDVFSELDESRCNALLECVSECQCIFTCAQDFIAESIETDITTVICKEGKLLA